MKLEKNYKVRVTPEQSRQIQELVFKLGGSLQSGDTFVKETHLERLYVSKCLKMSFGLTEHGWSYQEGATIQADELIALLTDLSKSAENPLENIELTPEFEAVKPTFKVGDKVYRGLKGEIRTVERVEIKSLYFAEGGCDFVEQCCHATQENYERLQTTFPDIEFEQPPKPLTGSDLARAMLDKGWKYVPCYMSNTSDKNAVELDDCGVIYTVNHNGNFGDGYGEIWCHAVPFDPRTGEPLTQAVLDE